MADFVFNIAKGRVAELVNRVQTNDPSTSRLVVIPLEATGLEAESVLIDADTFAAVIAGTTNEQVTMGRKYITDADLVAIAPDDTGNKMDVDIPNPTWTGATGNPIGAFVVCWNPDGADTTLVPLTHHTMAATPDGSEIVAVINAAGFFRSQAPA